MLRRPCSPLRCRVLFKLYKIVLMLFLLIFIGWIILFNIWWFFDCRYCFGHTCGLSLCENYVHKCEDKCYHQNLVHDKEIRIKASNKTVEKIDKNFWQKVIIENNDPFYVYSAFSRNSNQSVVILSTFSGNTTDRLFDYYSQVFECHFIDENQRIIQKIGANFPRSRPLIDTTRISCDLLSNNRPKYVRLVHKSRADLKLDQILIHYETDQSLAERPDIVVCVRPFFAGYSSVASLLEFIAYYRTNGVNKFAFYAESVTDPVLQLLNSMSDFVEVYPWLTKNGQRFPSFEHNYVLHQFAFEDDCLHRYRSKIIIIVDMDELIVPFKAKTLKDYIHSEYKSVETVGISVRNVFFCCEFNTNQMKAFPRILSHFNRQTHIWPQGWRTKLIILRPHHVDRIGVHTFWSYYGRVKHPDPKDVLMFHYRNCCGVGRVKVMNGLISYPVVIDDIEYDNRMIRFKDNINLFIDNYIEFH